ncbi:MAG TPA: carboxypeptidase-like regulatory domain-containing protein, partial [Bryobacteraceae bacterium]|nr:carboxypeptidase-like regulatory domain-containing protein [Bryobacteraceae bacterium]
PQERARPGVARIRGTVVHPDGTHFGGAVEIEPVDIGNPTAVAAISRVDGTFVTDELPPGRYRVGVDLGINRQPDEPYGRSYYPGTSDVTKAIEIQIGQDVPEPPPIVFTLPPERPTVRLRGTVVYEDGRPAPGVDVFFRPVGGYSSAQLWTDSKGNFTTTKYGSVAYRIQSRSRDGKHESMEHVIQAADLETPLLLVLRKAMPQDSKQP